METIVGAALKEIRLLLVGALVEIVTQLVMHRDEVLARHLQTGLDPNVVLAVDVPRTGMTNHVAITRFGELRALPERRRQRIESEGGVEALAVAHHPALIDSMGAQQRRHVDARRRCGWR